MNIKDINYYLMISLTLNDLIYSQWFHLRSMISFTLNDLIYSQWYHLLSMISFTLNDLIYAQWYSNKLKKSANLTSTNEVLLQLNAPNLNDLQWYSNKLKNFQSELNISNLITLIDINYLQWYSRNKKICKFNLAKKVFVVIKHS